jgi:predicted ATPase
LPTDEVLDRLQGLVDSSLVHPLYDGRGEPRFGMLETVREFALEQLEADHEAEHRASDMPPTSWAWRRRLSQR